MSKFKKKPIEIEGFQITEETRWDQEIWPEWLRAAYHKDSEEVGALFYYTLRNGEMHIRTLEGVTKVSLGDWIIQGIQGELYPHKPDIFEATYEPVDD